eukprot:scaffold3032_cov375-Prasinococcus_capsulatus_cf.AAC.16
MLDVYKRKLTARARQHMDRLGVELLTSKSSPIPLRSFEEGVQICAAKTLDGVAQQQQRQVEQQASASMRPDEVAVSVDTAYILLMTDSTALVPHAVHSFVQVSSSSLLPR